MIARLLGLAAISAAAVVGLAAQVVTVPLSYSIELKRRRLECVWDWDTAPQITARFDQWDAA